MQNLNKNQFVVSRMTRIWWILIQTLKSLIKLYFDWSLSSKVYDVWPKKVQRSYLSWPWRVVQNLKKNWIVIWKMTWGIWQIFIRTRESVKISTFMESFCPKQKIHELKIYRGVMCNDTEEWWKIWSAIDLPFQNWNKEFDKFWLTELNQNKNLKQPDRPDAVWEFYFTLEINE